MISMYLSMIELKCMARLERKYLKMHLKAQETEGGNFCFCRYIVLTSNKKNHQTGYKAIEKRGTGGQSEFNVLWIFLLEIGTKSVLLVYTLLV